MSTIVVTFSFLVDYGQASSHSIIWQSWPQVCLRLSLSSNTDKKFKKERTDNNLIGPGGGGGGGGVSLV